MVNNNQNSRKNFIPLNEGFVCEYCKKTIPKAPGTFRNHCNSCLWAKHVDKDIPGDRASTCQGLMEPIAVEGTDPDKLDIVHQCQRCGKIIKNKIARDDNKEALFMIMKKATL